MSGSSFPTSSLVAEATGPSKCWAKKIDLRFATQKKWEVTELIAARKDCENLFVNLMPMCCFLYSVGEANEFQTFPSQT